MRLLLAAVIAGLAILAGALAPARAQDARQLFDLFRGEMERQIERQRQRQFERDQRRQQQEDWEATRSQWSLCFDAADLAACDRALAFGGLAPHDRQRLIDRRDTILRERARQERLAAEAAARRLEEARQARALAERRAEERQLADMRAFARALDDCRRFDRQACDRAATSSIATADDQARIASWRRTAEQFSRDREAYRAGSVAACDQAALSPAADADQRRSIAEWRRAASPLARFTATVADTAATARDIVLAVPHEIAALPRPTQIAAALAMLLAAALAAMLWRQRTPEAAPPPSAPTASRPAAPARALLRHVQQAIACCHMRPLARRLRRLAFRLHVRAIAAVRRHATPRPTAPIPAPASTAADRPRDPETAIAALQLARAYLAELDGRLFDLRDDPVAIRGVLNTLSLVSQQLAIAERADPSAAISAEHEDGTTVTHSLAELKAQALFAEGICRSTEKPRRAIAILEQAAGFDPEHAGIVYFTGLLHMDLMHKRAAIAAFERALVLEPDNLEYRKMLVRAQSLAGVEVAYHKVATGVRFGVKAARVISLLLQLAPFTLLVVSAYMAAFATTPATLNLAVTLFLISVAMSVASMLYRRAKQRLSVWYRENAL